MTKNYIFREFECGLTREQTAKLCFKSVRTVTEWDKGKPIPPECKRLMRMSSRIELSYLDVWKDFRIIRGKLELPTGQKVSPQEILTGIALIQVQSELEIKVSTQLLKLARSIQSIKGR
nr:regulator [Vibrio fluvialis]